MRMRFRTDSPGRALATRALRIDNSSVPIESPVSLPAVSENPDDQQAAAPGPATRSIQYKGADLEPARGPGLGCFRFQLVLLAILVVLTPISVYAGWSDQLSAGLLFATIVLLLFTGQTMIFLLRLVAAERRGRRRPLASATPTVGEIEDAAAAPEPGVRQ
jgi:hypothetical protein